MNKVYAGVVVLIFLLWFMLFAEMFNIYDSKTRYLKDQVDNLSYKMKITGVITSNEYTDFKTKINGAGSFGDSDIIMYKAISLGNGIFSSASSYTPGEVLEKGDAFSIYIKSNKPSELSLFKTLGDVSDDTKNIYYKTKSEVRVEKIY